MVCASWKKRVRLGCGILVAVSLLWCASRNSVTVTNESGQTVRDLSVVICDRTFRLDDLEPGASASASFGTPRDESSFRVRGTLADGTVIDDTSGYVVWEDYGKQFHVVIRPDGMVGATRR
jgi:hypothetical protein